MGIKIRDETGTLRTITRIRFRDNTNTLRTIQTVKMRDSGGTLRTVFVYLSAALNMNNIIGVNSGASISGSVTTNLVTCTATGGVGPYNFLWTQTSGSSAIQINANTSAGTTFTVPTAYNGIGYIGSFVCTATDTNGAVAVSQQVVVEIYWFNTA